MARVIDRATPGPGARADLRIEGSECHEQYVVTLLQRAFHDLRSITVRPIRGGRSGALVWSVEPNEEGSISLALPVVAKIQPRGKMQAERSNYQLITRAVNFRLHAMLVPERTVEGHNHGIIVYSFVSKAQPLAQVLHLDPRRFISSLFERTLEHFAKARLEKGYLARRFLDPNDLGVLRWSDALLEAYVEAKRSGGSVYDPDALRARFNDVPAMEYRVTAVHGDLHVGNLFVPAGTDDVVLIDFGRARDSAPIVVDPACLEVDLVFPPRDTDGSEVRHIDVRRTTRDWRRRLYEFPLAGGGTSTLPGPEWLKESIRAIRSQVERLERNWSAYAVGLASFMIRYASYSDHATLEDRTLAYELACRLVGQVTGETREWGTV